MTSVQKLSDPTEEPLFDKRLVSASKNPDVLLPIENRPDLNKPSWKEQIEQRIKSKTKIKSTSSTKTAKKGKENRYSDVYGYFFFSLINTYDA